MSDIKQTLINLSRNLGREDRDLVILAEGNTSAKVSDETFLVKVSGANLATIDNAGLVECRFAPLLNVIAQSHRSDADVEAALLDSRVDPSAKKPSVEAMFHAVLLSLPGIHFVGHTHPVTVNGILSSAKVEAFAAGRRFPDEIVCCGERSLVVPYVDPGAALAREIAQRTRAFIEQFGAPPRVILLINHGLIAPAATSAGVMAATLMAEKAARIFAVAESLGGAVTLPVEQVARIAHRPDEHYRRAQLKM